MHVLKFFHMMCAVGLLMSVIYCVVAMPVVRRRKHNLNPLVAELNDPVQRRSDFILLDQLNRNLLLLSVLAMMTGTLLVYPAHFTFSTPWIQAAYLAVTFFFIAVCYLKARIPHVIFIKRKQQFYRFIYSLLFMILLLIVHDAVTKMTFLRIFNPAFIHREK